MEKRLDLPPLWMLVALCSVWAVSRMTPSGLGGAASRGLGAICLVASVLMILWGIVTLRTARTPVMPHQAPRHLVTTGPFAFSRNPIYLGLAGIVAALALWLGAPLALLVVPVFMGVIAKRFILPEEDRLAAAFGAEFEVWKRRSGRWLRLSSQGGES